MSFKIIVQIYRCAQSQTNLNIFLERTMKSRISRVAFFQGNTVAAFSFFRRSTRIFQISAYTLVTAIMRNDFQLTDCIMGARAMQNCSVRCPPRPISMMRQNIAADTTARTKEKKDIAIILSRLRRRLLLFSHLFIADASLNIGTSARTRARFPRDRSMLLQRLLDVLVHDDDLN